jgi:hypothetical protein
MRSMSRRVTPLQLRTLVLPMVNMVWFPPHWNWRGSGGILVELLVSVMVS